MTKLSPTAAERVLDAANSASSYGPDDCLNEAPYIAAATLRAAVEQVMPLTKTPWGSTLIPILTVEESRNGLLAIAAELEALNG
jgi:hypothetical protein